MAISIILDVSDDFNAAGVATLDVGEWDWGIVQLVSPSGTISFNVSNDSNAIRGVSDGNSYSSINFQSVGLTNQATGALVTSSAAAGTFKFGVIGKYFQLSGTANSVGKAIVFLSKIR